MPVFNKKNLICDQCGHRDLEQSPPHTRVSYESKFSVFENIINKYFI